MTPFFIPTSVGNNCLLVWILMSCGRLIFWKCKLRFQSDTVEMGFLFVDFYVLPVKLTKFNHKLGQTLP